MLRSKFNQYKYIEQSEQTANGVVYKNAEAFKARKGICYIGEYNLQDLEQADEDISDERLLELGIAEDYASIRRCVESHFDDFDDELKEMGIDALTEQVFAEADWTCIETSVMEMTY